MQNISILFYFGTTLYMFRTVFQSVIRSLRLYIQHQVYVIQFLWLLDVERFRKEISGQNFVLNRSGGFGMKKMRRPFLIT